MWNWILIELKKAVKAIHLNKNITGVDEDDIVSNVAVYLCLHQDIATEIYTDKKIGYLYKLVKTEIYEQKSKMLFSSKIELSRYQRIIAVCEKYGIEPIPANAYKISALLENGSANFTISGVIALLSADSPVNHGYIRREESLETMKEI